MHHPYPVVLGLRILLDQRVKGKYHETYCQPVLGCYKELGGDAMSQNRVKRKEGLDDRIWQLLRISLVC